MVHDQHVPHALAVSTPLRNPAPGQLVVGAAVAALAATADVRGAIGFLSFGVPVHRTVASASAWALTPAEGRPARIVPAAGSAGCLLSAFALPASSVVPDAAVLAVWPAWRAASCPS
ncbi:hypothetical protein [Streptomyces sp. WAC04114]|uniref:hypothetical protein n=1 Tax=Streptomyces sp. WAC04114 TaxID=2867961 RepID=UPI001C8C3C68|nr:hypothetical protein [Streptomyces sp. WAC04114]MBX9359686.1 hypothetical protein [Streptomyces sp. WAC04114]